MNFGDPRLPERFWAKVYPEPNTGCWLWGAGCTTAGYGVYHPVHGKSVAVHRFVLSIALGRSLVGWALHHCDVPPCLCPIHLYEGTHRQNVDDKVRRNRQRKGVHTPSHVLTEQQVITLRERYADGCSMNRIKIDFGVSIATVHKIVNGKAWVHVAGPIGARARGGSHGR